MMHSFFFFRTANDFITCSLMYGVEDPSIAGMVLDNPFFDLVDLMMELVDTYKVHLPKFTLSILYYFLAGNENTFYIEIFYQKFGIFSLNILLLFSWRLLELFSVYASMPQ